MFSFLSLNKDKPRNSKDYLQCCHFTWKPRKTLENLEFDNLGKKILEKPGIWKTLKKQLEKPGILNIKH